MPLQEVTIQFNDLEDTRQILSACLNYFFAKDLASAQMALSTSVQKSAIVQELEALKTKMDNYLSDYLLQQHEAGFNEEIIDLDDEGEAYKKYAALEEELEPEEELSTTPLGAKEMPKQKGRRLTKAELQKEEVEDDTTGS